MKSLNVWENLRALMSPSCGTFNQESTHRESCPRGIIKAFACHGSNIELDGDDDVGLQERLSY